MSVVYSGIAIVNWKAEGNVHPTGYRGVGDMIYRASTKADTPSLNKLIKPILDSS